MRVPSPPQSSNVCVVVVTYQPKGDLFEKLGSLRDHVARIVIVDNASDRTTLRARASATNGAIELMENDDNIGQAAALNQGFRAAIAHGFPWVLCLDQDSTPSTHLMAILREVYEAYDGLKPVGIISSGFGIPPISGIEPSFGDRPYSEVHTAITSGSLISVEAFERASGFREDFFIDSVDHEFSFRLLELGYAVLLTRKEGLQHEIGAPARRRFLWKKIATSNHSAARRYYMSRNRPIVFRTYAAKYPAWAKYMRRLHRRELIRWCLAEDDRLRKIYATLLGTFDAWRGKMGKVTSRFIR